MKINRKIVQLIVIAGLGLSFSACKSLTIVDRKENRNVPARFSDAQDTTNKADLKWNTYFKDPYLIALIDTALQNNQELNITLQELEIARNEIRARKGEYLPFAGVKAGAGVEKVGRYTSQGASDANTEIAPGKETPEALPDLGLQVFASWEVDIWHKLRNAKKAAYSNFIASVDGKNFLVTNLIAEIANSYYELIALDNQLQIVNQNIQIQSNALEIVKIQKEATRVTELAVRKFEAEVFRTKSLQFDIQQKIVVVENRINFLIGRFPQPIARNPQTFTDFVTIPGNEGIPSQLLENRMDVKQAEMQLEASRLNVKVAKASFYPSLNIRAGVGLQAFNPAYFIKTPQSMLYSLAGDLVAPLINRNALKASFYNANAKQIQAAFNYEKTVLNAYIEVANQLANIDNLSKSYELKSKQVDALNQSIAISSDLFQSARADYMEVLLTQRDALESKFELVETKKQLMSASVNIYRSLGGGWK